MDNKTINVEYFMGTIKRNYKIILITTLLATIIGGMISMFLMEPKYQATAKLFAGKDGSVQAEYSKDEIAMYRELMETYIEIIKTDDFLNEALENNNIEMTAEQIKPGLVFSSVGNAPIIEIKYTGKDAKIARDIVEAISTEFGTQVKEIILNANTKVIESVKVKTFAPNKVRIVIIALFIGLLSGLILILIRDYLDKTIKNREQLEGMTGIPVVGVIPKEEEV